MGARGRGRSQSGGRRWYDAAFFAASNGHARCIHILVDEGADIDVFSLNLRTPLNIAASGGHTDAVCALIAEGADVELSPFLRTKTKT